MMTQPSSLVAYVTSRCTQHCVFCTAGDQLLCTTDLTPAVLEACFAAFPSLRSVCLAGLGEPLCAHGLPQLVDCCFAHGRGASLITNGHLVRERFDEVPWARLLYVNISVNETDPRGYAALTGVDALPVVEDNVDLLLATGASVVASFTVDRLSFRRAPLFVEWAADRGISKVVIVNRLPRIGAHGELLDPEAFWSCVILRDSLEHAHVAALTAETATRLGVELQCLPMPIPDASSAYPVPSRCMSPLESLGVDGAGDVSLCRRLLAPSAAWGNVLRDGAAVWTSPRAEELRRQHREGDVPARCRACFGSWAC